MSFLEKIFGKKKKEAATVSYTAPSVSAAEEQKPSQIDEDRRLDAEVIAEFEAEEEKIPVPSIPFSDDEEIDRNTTAEGEVTAENASAGLAYEKTAEGECAITGMGSFEGSELVIPAEIDGLKVTEIKAKAFFECAAIKSVIVPYGVKCIGEEAFRKCTGLVSVKLPATLEKIDKSAFHACSALTEVIVPKSVTVVEYMAFALCDKLEHAYLPKGLKTIGNFAFEYSGLKEIGIPGGVRELGWGVFRNCKQLSAVAIGDGVYSISTECFKDCGALESIVFPESVKRLSNSFTYCWKLTKVKMPSKLYHLSGTFFSCPKLEAITVPEGITNIDDAFTNCEHLKSISLPSTISSLEDNCFEGCCYLEEVVYNGTRESFESVTLGEGWRDETEISSVTCTDGEYYFS